MVSSLIRRIQDKTEEMFLLDGLIMFANMDKQAEVLFECKQSRCLL